MSATFIIYLLIGGLIGMIVSIPLIPLIYAFTDWAVETDTNRSFLDCLEENI